ncbi:P-loop NTPase fold protein [Pseudomonas sp. BN411]|uniref:KAP family P-loop NTPase fold protein n=1 Tax=Pseudomonas sp. BN411 TaxID=2567887 RepID=UPI0024558BFA|nr:P-loop NTPase fold protein [Pseudomonas sp. BN411]MDH4562884.1 NTPase [Pseudomonas sp. BN411]
MTEPWKRLKQWFRNQAKSGEDSLTHPLGEIGSESPIRTKAEDRLRRAGYADRIAGVLSELSPREGRVFAIRGGWGFGKSSLKYLVIEQLNAKSDDVHWVDFNPWQWGDGNAITRALFGQIADRLGGDHSQEAIERAEALRRYGAILSGASAPLKTAGGASQKISAILTNASVISVASAIGFNLPKAATLAAVLAGLSLATSLLGRLLKHLGRDRSGESIDQIRKALEDRLRNLKRPLIVFVDDIDRLEPEQIRVLLRQVKANANLPNIVFVLLFQPSIVERALDPVADGNGRAFLEKIVQANFDLPAVPTYMVHQIFGEQLSQLARHFASEQNDFSDVRWGNGLIGCIQPRLRNMRDAHRLLSSIALHLPLHASGDLFEVNLVDFLILETLRVFEPDLHEALFREKSLILQELRYRSEGRRAEVQAAAKRLLEIVPDDRRELAQDTIKMLFPPLEWALGGPEYDDGYRLQWLAAKQVCTPRFFPRYFELQTALGEVSERRFVEFLDAASTDENLAASIAEFEADGLLPSLVARLDESADRLPVEKAAVLLPGMFIVAQKFVRFGGDPFSSPWVSGWRATLRYLKAIPEDKRGSLAIEALRATKALSVAAMLIHLNDPADHKDREAVNFNPALDLATVEAMKAIWLHLIRSRAADKLALIAEPDLIHLLYRWKHFAGSLEEPRRWMRGAISTDEGFADIAKSTMSVGTSHTAGDRVTKVHNMFSREAFEDFIGLDVAKARCEAINPADFPDHELPLTTLRNQVTAWLENKGNPIYV